MTDSSFACGPVQATNRFFSILQMIAGSIEKVHSPSRFYSPLKREIP